MLIVHDRDTNICGAFPTQQKRSRSFQYLVPELSRFIVETGQVEVSLKCDCEPSTTSLAEAVHKACAGLRITVHLEPTPTEIISQMGQLRLWCMCFVQKPICLYNKSKMPPDEPSPSLDVCTLFTHGPWFTAAGFTTSLERSTGRFCSGKVALFGETVLAWEHEYASLGHHLVYSKRVSTALWYRKRD